MGSLFPDQDQTHAPCIGSAVSTIGLPLKSLPSLSLSLSFLDNLGKGLSVYLWISMLEVMVVYAPPLHYCIILDSSIYLPISAGFILFAFCVAVLCPIVSTLMTHFSISCKTCLVVMNTFSFYLSFLENCFARYVKSFLGWQFFFFCFIIPLISGLQHLCLETCC